MVNSKLFTPKGTGYKTGQIKLMKHELPKKLTCPMKNQWLEDVFNLIEIVSLSKEMYLLFKTQLTFAPFMPLFVGSNCSAFFPLERFNVYNPC